MSRPVAYVTTYVIPTLGIEIPISYRKSYWRKSKLTGNEKKKRPGKGS